MSAVLAGCLPLTAMSSPSIVVAAISYMFPIVKAELRSVFSKMEHEGRPVCARDDDRSWSVSEACQQSAVFWEWKVRRGCQRPALALLDRLLTAASLRTASSSCSSRLILSGGKADHARRNLLARHFSVTLALDVR